MSNIHPSPTKSSVKNNFYIFHCITNFITMIADYLRLKKSVEVTLIIIIAIWILSFDKSHNQVNSNLEEIWEFRFSKEIHSNNIDEIIKYILSFIVLVRAFTSRLFLFLYIIMLWPAVFETKSFLIIPWLIVGFLRTIVVTFLTLSTGCYSCLLQKGFHLICLDFILSQVMDHGPAIYAWISVLSFYRTISTPKQQKNNNVIITGQGFISVPPLSNLMIQLRPWGIPARSLDTLLSLDDPVLICKNKDSCSLVDGNKKTVNFSEDAIDKINLDKSTKDCNVTQSANILRKISKNSILEEKELHCLSWDESYINMKKKTEQSTSKNCN